jgi:regulator of RNase E activity RraA
MKKKVEDHIRFLKTCETGFVTDALLLLKINTGCWMDGVFSRRKGDHFVGQAFTTQLSYIDIDKDAAETTYYQDMVITRTDGLKIYTTYEILGHIPKEFVWVIGGSNGGNSWGDKIYNCAYQHGVSAVVFDGTSRDNVRISEGPLPMYCKGISIRIDSSRLKWIDYNVPIICANANVKPGDIVMGDDDGVVVIPLEHLDEVMYQVEMVKEVDTLSDEAIKNHLSPMEVQNVIRKKAFPRK